MNSPFKFLEVFNSFLVCLFGWQTFMIVTFERKNGSKTAFLSIFLSCHDLILWPGRPRFSKILDTALARNLTNKHWCSVHIAFLLQVPSSICRLWIYQTLQLKGKAVYLHANFDHLKSLVQMWLLGFGDIVWVNRRTDGWAIWKHNILQRFEWWHKTKKFGNTLQLIILIFHQENSYENFKMC